MVASFSCRMHTCNFHSLYPAFIEALAGVLSDSHCQNTASWHFSTFVFLTVVSSPAGSPYYYSATARGAAAPAAAAAYDRH